MLFRTKSNIGVSFSKWMASGSITQDADKKKFHRIQVRLQGASAVRIGYLPVVAAPWTRAKTSRMVKFLFAGTLQQLNHET
jgi:hypothetical protein